MSCGPVLIWRLIQGVPRKLTAGIGSSMTRDLELEQEEEDEWVNARVTMHLSQCPVCVCVSWILRLSQPSDQECIWIQATGLLVL